MQEVRRAVLWYSAVCETPDLVPPPGALGDDGLAVSSELSAGNEKIGRGLSVDQGKDLGTIFPLLNWAAANL